MRIGDLKWIAAAALAAAPIAAQPATSAEWTVMVYMNADNNLEPFALLDFKEMAKVEYPAAINVVVQFDRIGTYTPWETENVWARTHRFKMKKGLTPTEENAISGDGGLDNLPAGEANMGDPATLADFVEWSRHEFPARRYFLVLWDHGQGWRAPIEPGDVHETDPESAAVIFEDAEDPFRSGSTSPYRSVSDDHTSGDHLFNREIVEALQPIFQTAPLDLLGFDACFMAMVETAYSFRHLAKVMVGSEELEHGYGWNYTRMLGKLVDQPTLEADTLGEAVVEAYAETWGKTTTQPATLSAVRLDTIEILAERLSDLSDDLIDRLDELSPELIEARSATPVYAPGIFQVGSNLFQHVDLGEFLEQLSARCSDAVLRNRIRLVQEALDFAVIASWAHLRDAWGNQGLAIYFPVDQLTYNQDAYEKGGYRKCNTLAPVEFVQRQRWADFLHAYLAAAVSGRNP